MAKVMNYTEEQTQHMIEEYTKNPTRETVEDLANKLGKTVKSIIGKLSREKVYQKREYETKTGSKPITKLEITKQIAETLTVDAVSLEGLSKASKSDLMNLQKAIDAKLQ